MILSDFEAFKLSTEEQKSLDSLFQKLKHAIDLILSEVFHSHPTISTVTLYLPHLLK